MNMSGREARGPEEQDAPLEWRAPSERLALVILDHFRRTHFSLVWISAVFAQLAALAQQVPAAIELDVDLRQALALGVRHLALGVELLLLGHQLLDMAEDVLVRRMQRHDDLLERLTQCHQSQIVEAALAQPVG